MSTVPLRSAAPWHTLYLAALFEPNRDRLQTRISEAERALLVRERELFGVRLSSEHQAINNALNALHALRDCLGLR
ncbi:MAG TPA: hypothetical protein VMH85_04215 [Terriglobales bacterium]|nr:hypothetical protein [Terriglobales bacterium]